MTPLEWLVLTGRAAPEAGEWEATARRALVPEPGSEPPRLAHAPGAAIAWTGDGDGALARDEDRLCLFDGVLDEPDRLAEELGLPPGRPAPTMALRAWLRWGAGGLERLDGDWVVVVVDARERAVVVARDRVGARAAFLARSGAGIAVASEVAPLLRALPATPAPDRIAMVQWLASEALSDGRTLYEGVHRVLPGRLLRAGANGEVREDRWWRPRYRPPAPAGADAAAEIRDRVAEMVRRRLDEERPSGLLLSAGLDSAGVAALAARERPDAVLGLNAAFPELPAVDESERVDRLLRDLRLAGVRAEAGAGGLLAAGLEHIERFALPPVGWSDFWEQPLLRAGRDAGCRVVLHGEGGDELFGVRTFLVGDALRRGRPLRAARLVARLPGAAFAHRRDLLRGLAVDGARLAAPAWAGRGARRLRPKRVPGWLSESSAALLRATANPSGWRALDGPMWWSWLAWVLCERVEALGALEHLRRRAAWSGLATRHPLLNAHAIDLALGLAPESTFDARLDRMPFRRALAGLLPDELRLRPDKSLFDDLVVASVVRDAAAATAVLGDRPRVAELCAPGAPAALLDEGRMRGARPFAWARDALRLVMLECWLRELETPGSAARLRDAEAFSAPRVRIARISGPGTG